MVGLVRYKAFFVTAGCVVAGAVGAIIGWGVIGMSNLAPSEKAIEIQQVSIQFWHDRQRKVGCWIAEGEGGMACIADGSYTPVLVGASDVPVVLSSPDPTK